MSPATWSFKDVILALVADHHSLFPDSDPAVQVQSLSHMGSMRAPVPVHVPYKVGLVPCFGLAGHYQEYGFSWQRR